MTFKKTTCEQYVEDVKEFWLSRVKRIDSHRGYLEDKLASLRHVLPDAELRAALIDDVAASEAKRQEALRAKEEQMERNVELRSQLRDLMNTLDASRKARKDEELVLQAAVAAQDRFMVECEKDVGEDFRKIVNRPETRTIGCTAGTVSTATSTQTGRAEFEIKKLYSASAFASFTESHPEPKQYNAASAFASFTESHPEPKQYNAASAFASPIESHSEPKQNNAASAFASSIESHSEPKQYNAASAFASSTESRSEPKQNNAASAFASSIESHPEIMAHHGTDVHLTGVTDAFDDSEEPRETVFPDPSPYRTALSSLSLRSGATGLALSQQSASSSRDRELPLLSANSSVAMREPLGRPANVVNRFPAGASADASVTSKQSYHSEAFRAGRAIHTLERNQGAPLLQSESPPQDYASMLSEPELSPMMSSFSVNTTKSNTELDLLEQLQSMQGAATPSVWTAAILYHPDLSVERNLLARMGTLMQTANTNLVEQNWMYIEEIGRRIGAAIDVTCDSDDIELTLKMMRDSSLKDLEKVYRPVQAKLEQDEGKSLQLLLDLTGGYFSRPVPKLTGAMEYSVAAETQSEVDAFLTQLSSRLPFPCKLHAPGLKGLLRALEKKHLFLPTLDIVRAALEFDTLHDLTTTLELLNQAADVRRVTCRFGPAGSGNTGWGDVICVLVLNGCPWELQMMHNQFVAVDMSRTEAYSSYRYAKQMLQYMEKRD